MLPANDCAIRLAVLRSLPLATEPVSSTLSLVTLTWMLSLLRLGSCCSACWICCCICVVSPAALMLPCEPAALAWPLAEGLLLSGVAEGWLLCGVAAGWLLCEPIAEGLLVSGVVEGWPLTLPLWLEVLLCAEGVVSVAAPVELDGLLCEPVLEPTALGSVLLGCCVVVVVVVVVAAPVC